MSTALEVYHPLIEHQQRDKMSFPRRGTLSSAGVGSPSTTEDCSQQSSAHHHQPYGYQMTTLEDSGNVNNQRIASFQQTSSRLQPSSSHFERTERDSSTWVNTGTSGGGAPVPLSRAPSSASLKARDVSKTGSSRSLQRGKSFEDDADASTKGEQVIEEKRKRANGEGYTIHRYTLGRMLGKGGFAKVYQCTSMDNGKSYAVKVVPKANLVKARARQKLQAEIKIHRSLKHKHVCQYKHYFEDRNNCYILLELCHNQSLNEMIKRRKRLTEPEAAYFMRQLLEATRYMHEQNVIHRDLKLGNLFLDKDMQIKVGDLGLATRVEDKDEKRKTICGTPNYIAPEIIQGDKAKRGHSFEVDVWSMGVILYTILFGKPPYEAKDVKATYQRILNNEYSFPRHIDASEDAKTLIQSMLQSKPADRPTLDDIEANPFLVGRRMPTFLPTSVLSIAPTWRLDEFGDLVCSEEPRSRKPGIPLSNSGRQPFGSHEPNLRRAASTNTPGTRREKSGRDVVNMERVVRTALAAMGSGGTSQTTTSVGAKKASSVASSSPGFKIFDESAGASYQGSSRGAKPPPAQRTVSASSVDFLAARDEGNAPHDTRSVVRSRPPPQMQSSPFALTEEALSARTRNLAISGPSPRNNSGTASSVFTHATSSVLTNTENEVDILQKMADHLDAVIEITESRRGTYRSTLPRPVSPRRAPGKWVTRYVDYTSKYGLGFLLNDGSSGVYFNDSTKTALEAHGEKFQYIERKKSADDGLPKRRGETTVETHTLASYPESLKKKVTLLKHFRNYLVEQQKKADEDDNSSPTDSDPFIGSDLVYVKKWVRTNHAILFCLSNRTVQAVFYDQTEILLTPDVAFLTYVDKNRRRSTYDFTDELVGSSPEIEKRLKYTKEILHQLLTGQRC